MYLSNNYMDINIYPLTMNVMRLWACLYGKGAISNDNIIIIIIIIYTFKLYMYRKLMFSAVFLTWQIECKTNVTYLSVNHFQHILPMYTRHWNFDPPQKKHTKKQTQNVT